MKVVKNLVSQNNYKNKCPYTMDAEFYVVHNTANDASAKNEIAYMIRNTNKVSFHYAIDDKEVVQGILENRNSFNAGDGVNGKGNRKGIAIEICYSKSGGNKFVEAEKNTAKFIAQGLKEKNWGINKVKKHQDFSNKNCPHRTLSLGWQRFLNMIQAEMGSIPKPSTPELTGYKGASIVDYLNSIGVNSSYSNRAKLAAQHGISNYTGTAAQNTKLLNVLIGQATSNTSRKTIDQMAREVIAGQHGNGHENRRKSLGISQTEYQKVRNRVNKLM